MAPADHRHPFGDLTPEQFRRETSARSEQPRGQDSYRPFVAAQLDRCIRHLFDDANVEPYAALGNADIERYFYGEPDEYPADFAARLTREARAMNAYWLFVAMLGPFRVHPADDPEHPIDTTDHQVVQAAIDRGDMQVGLIWSACSTRRSEVIHSGGAVSLDSNGYPAQVVTGQVNPHSDPFHRVLLDDEPT